VAVPMMYIGVVRVAVLEGFVSVLVRVRFTTIPGESVLMPMMHVVPMRVRVG
jgi:hypothetical protein